LYWGGDTFLSLELVPEGFEDLPDDLLEDEVDLPDEAGGLLDEDGLGLTLLPELAPDDPLPLEEVLAGADFWLLTVVPLFEGDGVNVWLRPPRSRSS
jgi:hypothetical protein